MTSHRLLPESYDWFDETFEPSVRLDDIKRPMAHIIDILIDNLRYVLPLSIETALTFEDTSAKKVETLIRFICSHPRNGILMDAFRNALWKHPIDMSYLLKPGSFSATGAIVERTTSVATSSRKLLPESYDWFDETFKPGVRLDDIKRPMAHIIDILIRNLRCVLPLSTWTVLNFEDTAAKKVDTLIRFVCSHPRNGVLMDAFRNALWKHPIDISFLLKPGGPSAIGATVEALYSTSLPVPTNVKQFSEPSYNESIPASYPLFSDEAPLKASLKPRIASYFFESEEQPLGEDSLMSSETELIIPLPVGESALIRRKSLRTCFPRHHDLTLHKGYKKSVRAPHELPTIPIQSKEIKNINVRINDLYAQEEDEIAPIPNDIYGSHFSPITQNHKSQAFKRSRSRETRQATTAQVTSREDDCGNDEVLYLRIDPKDRKGHPTVIEKPAGGQPSEEASPGSSENRIVTTALCSPGTEPADNTRLSSIEHCAESCRRLGLIAPTDSLEVYPDARSLLEHVFLDPSGVYAKLSKASKPDNIQFVSMLETLCHFPGTSNHANSFISLCRSWIRKIARKTGILPKSLFVLNVETREQLPVQGGGFSDVYKGSLNGRTVALKVLRVFAKDNETQQVFLNLCQEALLWQDLEHPHILPFFGISDEIFYPRLCLISPWMEHGNIVRYLAAQPNPHSLRIPLLLQIISAIEYIHQSRPSLIHGDIKGANILISKENNGGTKAYLCDFGLLSICENSQFATTAQISQAGSVRWMAPELFSSSQGTPCRSSDVYALSMTILEIFTLAAPFSHLKSDPMVMFAVCAGERPRRPENCELPDRLWNLMQSCWSSEKFARPSITTVHNEFK